MNEKSACGFRLLEMLENYWFYQTDDLFEVFQVADNLQYIKNRMWGYSFNSLISNEIPKKRREVILECEPVYVGDDYYEIRLQDTIGKKLEEMSEEEIDQIIDEQEAYEEWMEICNQKYAEIENEKWILTSEKADDYIKIKPLTYNKSTENGIKYMHIPVKQNKVVWICLSFDASDFKDHIEELRLLVFFLKHRSSGDFYGLSCEDAKQFLTNNFSVELNIDRDFENKDNISHLRIDISACALEENIPDVIHLMLNTIFNVFIAAPEIEEGIHSRIRNFEDDFIDDPSWLVDVLAGKNIDDRLKLMEKAEGLSYYYFLKAIQNSGNDLLEPFYMNCYAMINRIFSNENLMVFCNSTQRGLNLVKKTLNHEGIEVYKDRMPYLQKSDYKKCFLDSDDYSIRREFKKWKKFFARNYDNTEVVDLDYPHPQYQKGNIAVIIPSNVNYISLYGKLSSDYDYRKSNIGAIRLAFDLIEQDYLREEIRHKGGAYGYNACCYTSGYVCFSSFRDSHLKNTIKTFENIGEYIRNLDVSEERLMKLKITRISQLMSEEDNYAWDDQEDVRSIEIKKMIPELDQKIVEQIKECSVEDIRKTADMIDEAIRNGFVCVAGSKTSIEKHSNMFSSIEMFLPELKDEE